MVRENVNEYQRLDLQPQHTGPRCCQKALISKLLHNHTHRHCYMTAGVIMVPNSKECIKELLAYRISVWTTVVDYPKKCDISAPGSMLLVAIKGMQII